MTSVKQLGCLFSLILVFSPITWAGPEQDLALGIAAYNRGDVVDAISKLRRAAGQGHAPAQVWLAYVLDKSEANTEAVTWYRRAAEQGDAEGQFGLGQMYLTGEGVNQDTTEAVRWMTLAAERGHTGAMRALFINYDRGAAGLAKDPAQAKHWLQQAAKQGDPWATQKLKELP